MKTIYLILIGCLLSSTLIHSQKQVYWIHGLNDTPEYWQRYRYDLTREYSNTAISYTCGRRINTIASEVNNSITSNAVLIAHSTGGLIARVIQQNNSNVKALVTVGTPNAGAGIVSTLNNKNYYGVINESKKLAESAVNKSINAAVVACIPIVWIGLPLITIINHCVSNELNKYAELAKNEADNYITTHYLSDLTVQDMQPASSFMGSMYPRYINVPIINIAGEEDYPIPVRMLGTMSKRADVVSMNNTNDQNYDDSFLPIYNDILGVVASIRQGHTFTYDVIPWVAWFLPWLWGVREMVRDAEFAWGDVQRFIDTDIHRIYSGLIGAVHYERRTYTVGIGSLARTYTNYVAIAESHDGLIPAKSTETSPSRGISVTNIRVKGVNHLEMGSHSEMRNLLFNILNSQGYDQAFNPRNK